MLQAFTRNKARRYLIDRTSARVPTEDIITACVFGGLHYFPTDKRTNLLNAMLSDEIDKFSSVTRVTLWERDGIEPDVTVTGECRDGRKYELLIECKWGAPLDAQQIRKQAEKLENLKADKRAHIVVVRKSFGPDAGVFEALVSQGHALKLVTWRTIGQRLSGYARATEGCWSTEWANDVSIVIEKVGFPPFRGWSKIRTIELARVDLNGPLFWSGSR